MQELNKYKDLFHEQVRKVQDQVCRKIQDLDPEVELIEDIWEREDFEGNPGGGGITRVFTGDKVENAGVNTSLVYGKISPEFAKKFGGNADQMWATGVSLIIHPRNPKVPTTHANFRMIQIGDKHWFGGGADLTPYYPIEEDFLEFHSVWEKVLRPYGHYKSMKETCDTYFTNTHRDNEMRGIGGIFYDHFNSGDLEKDFEMVSKLSEEFIPSYFPLAKRRIETEWTPEDEEFQLHRRGRYVEFNLLHDRGTKFGLESNGRTDSILVSLPKRCMYSYKYAPKPDGPHAKMMEYYKPKDWV
ncbi:MAG: oxygen-dependent coproporphyrinogen oxidase [Bacteriovoracaceae bacterium]|nr:oxygen-dependent coproporphyrinogen oxidase [Bacteriovoracaceae bacterium]